MNVAHTNVRAWAAVMTGILLLAPLILAVLPIFTRAGFPGPYNRTDAIIAFFVAVPLLFALLAAYRVAEYRGLIGVKEEKP